MKRKNPASASKTNAPIELTPLLDVIFIILFIVIISNALNTKKVTAEAESAAGEARQELLAREKEDALKDEEIASLEAGLSDLKDQLFDQEALKAGYEERLAEYEDSVIGRRVRIITISCVYDPQDTAHRRLSAAAPDGDFAPVDFNNDNAETTFARLANWLEQYIEANSSESRDKAGRVIIVLSVGTEQILKRDRETLDRMIAALEEKYDDVY